MVSERLPRRTLRTMRERWQRDYDRLEQVYGSWEEGAESDGDPFIETMRNLATAIVWVDGLISSKRPGDRP
jgi:hypothetical protein